eukprot:2847788-Rhodomonas_salina.5
MTGKSSDFGSRCQPPDKLQASKPDRLLVEESLSTHRLSFWTMRRCEVTAVAFTLPPHPHISMSTNPERHHPDHQEPHVSISTNSDPLTTPSAPTHQRHGTRTVNVIIHTASRDDAIGSSHDHPRAAPFDDSKGRCRGKCGNGCWHQQGWTLAVASAEERGRQGGGRNLA